MNSHDLIYAELYTVGGVAYRLLLTFERAYISISTVVIPYRPLLFRRFGLLVLSSHAFCRGKDDTHVPTFEPRIGQ